MGYRYHGHDHKKVRKFILLEFLVIVLSILVASSIYNLFGFGSIELSSLLSIYTLACILIIQLSVLALGLYEFKIRETQIGVFRRLLVAVSVSYLLIELMVFQSAMRATIPQYLILFCTLTSFLALLIFRLTFWNTKYLGVIKRNVLVMGAGERASIIEKRMRRAADRRGIEVTGFVKLPGDKEGHVTKETVLEFDDPKDLEEFVYSHDISEVIVASDERRGTIPLSSLFDFKIRGIEITDILDFIERETGQIAVTLIYPSWVIYSNGFRSSNYLKLAAGYFFNFFLALIVLALTFPFIALTALAIFLDDGWKRGSSIFYRQERIGKNGQIFNILKFRSMRMDAESQGAQFAQKKDARVTRIGEFIRKYRLDELPQLINVFRGEMAFVGPRPERPQFVKDFVKEIPYYNQRHNVKPGLTGWAQLNYPYGSSTEDTIEKLKYDLYYIKHSSILFDLLILLRTVEVVLFGKGR